MHICLKFIKGNKKKKTTQHDCVVLLIKKSLEIIFVCKPCFFWEIFKADLFFHEVKKCLIELYLKEQGCRFSGDVNTVNLLNEKRKYLKGEITIVHCRGHDCIILFFNFEGF